MDRVERWGARGLFVSSTFEDMHAERDFLQEVIFGELEDLLRSTKHRLEPVDLRWGIDTISLPTVPGRESPEDVEHQKQLAVLTYCLDCVEKCQPFMLVFLGDRYGWIPPIERTRQAARSVAFRGSIEDRSVTALEIEYGVLDSQAQMRRTHFFLRQLDYTTMSVEQRCRFSDAQRAANETDSAKQAEAQHSANLLEQLKHRIVAECPGRVHDYRARWHLTEGVTGFKDELRSLIIEHVGKDLVDATQDSLLRQPRDWIEGEARALHEFIDFRARIFWGREAIATELIDICLSPSASAGLAQCIIGGPGMGKSSLFSHLSRELNRLYLRQLRQRDQLRPEQTDRLNRLELQSVLLLGHAAGMSPRSTGIRDLLIRWIRELAQSLGQADTVNESTSTEDLQGTFDALLFQAAGSHRIILLLDGLNHFERTDRGKYLGWLPRELPPNCRVLATANAGDESTEFERRGWQVWNLDPLDEAAIRAIFSAVCQRLYSRQGDLFEDVRAALVGKRDGRGQCAGGNPLWLRLALDLLNQLDEQTFSRQWTEPFRSLAPDARLNALLIDVIGQMPGDVDQLYGWLLERAEAVAGHFGQPRDARLFTCLIAVSRSGLRGRDFKAILPTLTGEPWSDLRLSVLQRAFRAHLVQRGELAQWDFFHPQMRSGVRQRYLADPQEEARLRRCIALYLSGRLDGVEPLPADDPLAEQELMHHWLFLEDEGEIARCCAALALGSREADTAIADLVQDCCREDRTKHDARSWFHRVIGRLAREVEAEKFLGLLIGHVLPRLKTFATNERRREFAHILWDVTEAARSTQAAQHRLLYTARLQSELAQALSKCGDLANAAWHFQSIIRMVNETAKDAAVPETLLLVQCQACQALAGLLSTPVVLGLYQEADHYLSFARSLVERQLDSSNPRDFRWSVLHISLLIDRAAIVSGEHQESLVGSAQQATEAIAPEPIRLHALGVVALVRSRYLGKAGEAATALAEAQSSVAILKQVHARFPSVLEPLQHLIEAITHLCTSSNCPPEVYEELTADLEWLVAHLKRLSNGNEDLIPTPFRVVDSLFHVHYWASVTDQVKSLIDNRDFERAELLAELTWQAMRNLARNGSWLPRGRHVEEYLCEVASHCLAIATFLHKGNPDRLAVAMRRVAEAVGLSLVRNRPVDAGLRDIYEMLLQAQPALREVESEDDGEELRSGNASMLFEPTLRFDGTGWESCLSAVGEQSKVVARDIYAHLGLLAIQTCMEFWLDSVNGSDIYQVPAQSWQAGELLKYQEVCTVYDARAFEEAVQNPKVRTIFVPDAAHLTQGLAVAILRRNPLRKHVFWEAKKTVPDTAPGTEADGGDV